MVLELSQTALFPGRRETERARAHFLGPYAGGDGGEADRNRRSLFVRNVIRDLKDTRYSDD